MAKVLDGNPDLLALLQEVLDTVGDYKEDILGENIDRKLLGLQLENRQDDWVYI